MDYLDAIGTGFTVPPLSPCMQLLWTKTASFTEPYGMIAQAQWSTALLIQTIGVVTEVDLARTE